MKLKLTKPGLIAMFIWVLGIVLAFVIPASSPYLWLSDALLLLGFFPLLIGHRANWLWLLFGILDIIIGWFLTMATVIPDEQFNACHLVEIKKHIAIYHPFLVWILIGAVSTVIGIIRLLSKFIVWIVKKLRQ